MDTRTAQAGPTRRTVLATTAFAVPAIAMTARAGRPIEPVAKNMTVPRRAIPATAAILPHT